VNGLLHPIADRVAQNSEIISKKLQFSTRRTRILMGFIVSTIYYVVLIANPMGRIVVRLKKIINHLEILYHPTCNWLYINHWFVYCLLHKLLIHGIRALSVTRISDSYNR